MRRFYCIFLLSSSIWYGWLWLSTTPDFHNFQNFISSCLCSHHWLLIWWFLVQFWRRSFQDESCLASTLHGSSVIGRSGRVICKICVDSWRGENVCFTNSYIRGYYWFSFGYFWCYSLSYNICCRFCWFGRHKSSLSRVFSLINFLVSRIISNLLVAHKLGYSGIKSEWLSHIVGHQGILFTLS